ncbi:MAG: molybdopterin-dependent oxidoreductase, partial [Oscillospiraceae bacterium]|nr:molybdopterin-dependent oxidoreductase [Oscillospiraceae bacterium]
YTIPNVKTDTFGVFTNNIHGGAMRGYSSPQLIWGQEQLIEEIAEELGMDPLEFRRINCLKDGTTNATGTVLDHVNLLEIMNYTAEQTGYQQKHEEYRHQTGTRKRKGIGIAIAHRGCGLGAESPDASGAMAIANEDGTVLINTGLAENGQGLKTAFSQIAAEAIGVPYETIRFYGTDTQAIADSGMTVASRGTVMGAQSTRKVGYKLNEIMRANALALGFFKDQETVKDISQIVLEDGFFHSVDKPEVKIPFKDVCNASLWTGRQMAAYEWFMPEPCIQDHHTGQGVAFPNYAYGCVVAEVEVDMETGYVDLQKVTASHDVGVAVNPALVRGQIYGGILMGQGYGITEEVEVSKGQVRNQNFENYIIPTAMDMPEMQVNIFECDDPRGTFGAKSIGEPATEAVGAAIANAIYNATGKRIRENPATLERVLLGKKLR